MLTPDEIEIIRSLGKIWDDYLELPKLHEMEQSEFCSNIHNLQNAIAARPALRELNKSSDDV